MSRYLFPILFLILSSRSSEVRSANALNSPASQNGSTSIAPNASVNCSNLTTNLSTYPSLNDHIDHVESEVLDFRNRTNRVNETLQMIYEKELRATKEISRISSEIKKIQIIAPIFILFRALKPLIQKLIAKIA